MMFVAMAEDAIVTIHAETFTDAKAFGLVELGATDDHPVLVTKIADGPTADVELRWCGTEACVSGGRWLQVYRRGHGKHSKWRAVDADRAWWDRVQRKEVRPPESSPHPLPLGPTPGETCTVTVTRHITSKALDPGQPSPVLPPLPSAQNIEPRRWMWTEADKSLLEHNLTATQKRSGELLEEARFARRETTAWVTCVRRMLGLDPERSGLEQAISAVMDERGRQDAKWGPVGARNAPQNALAIPFGTGLSGAKELADEARASCDAAFKRGDGTWADVIREEVAEALAETDPENLRRELVQLAAVCVKLVEILDWKAAR